MLMRLEDEDGDAGITTSQPRLQTFGRPARPHFHWPATVVYAAEETLAAGPCPLVSRGPAALVKRAIDIVGATLLLFVCGLPMLLVALLVKLTSPGPVLYKQERVGQGGRRFMLLKFRTMCADAEAQTGPVWARRHDPRRTRLGAILRRSSLDELPQLINVLWGEMSLVGPRPERPYFVAQFSEDLPSYMQRHSVPPGLTGWAQLNGLRGNTSIGLRLDFDLHYIRHWSLALDLFIMLLTPFKMLTDKNAY